jgi:6-phosphogluconolactonase
LRAEKLDWPKVWITLADERWVDTASEESNERMVREILLSGPVAAAHFIGLKNPAPTPEAGAEWATRALTRALRPFDVVVLGMGEDGHTASLFPGSIALSRALDASAAPARRDCECTGGAARANDPESRGAARRTSYHPAFRRAGEMAGVSSCSHAGAAAELPVRAILHQKETPVDVFWSP